MNKEKDPCLGGVEGPGTQAREGKAHTRHSSQEKGSEGKQEHADMEPR